MDLKPLVLKNRDLIITSRLILLPKTFLIMFFGAIAAQNGFPKNTLLLLPSFLAIGPLLWTGLYSMGNYFDIGVDRLDSRKKDRPLVKGTLSKAEILGWSIAFTLGGLVASYAISTRLFVVAICMLISQMLYSAPIFRLKEKFLGDIALVAVANPSLRFLAGWFAYRDSMGFPVFALIFLLSVHLMGELTKDLLNRKFEVNVGYKSTSVVLGKRWLYWSALAAYFAAVFSALIMCLSGIFGLEHITRFPVELSGLFLLSLSASPYFFKVIKDPEDLLIDKVRRRGWIFSIVVFIYTTVAIAIKL